jgi:hypothetical protein
MCVGDQDWYKEVNTTFDVVVVVSIYFPFVCFLELCCHGDKNNHLVL